MDTPNSPRTSNNVTSLSSSNTAASSASASSSRASSTLSNTTSNNSVLGKRSSNQISTAATLPNITITGMEKGLLPRARDTKRLQYSITKTLANRFLAKKSRYTINLITEDTINILDTALKNPDSINQSEMLIMLTNIQKTLQRKTPGIYHGINRVNSASSENNPEMDIRTRHNESMAQLQRTITKKQEVFAENTIHRTTVNHAIALLKLLNKTKPFAAINPILTSNIENTLNSIEGFIKRQSSYYAAKTAKALGNRDIMRGI